MPQILRMVQLGHWLHFDQDWLTEGDIPADPIGDLKTSENKMSVWVLDEGTDSSRIVSALAANRDKLDKFDFALIDAEILSTLGIKRHLSHGNSSDEQLNASCHYDLVELSAGKIIDLAKEIIRAERFTRVERENVAQLIAAAVKNRWIKEEELRLRPNEMTKIKHILEKNGEGVQS